jgi:ParB/RepB/Spo0J family partition protein
VSKTPTIVEIPVNLIFGNPAQPRQAFDQAELEDLAVSIAQNGLLQPIKVTKRGKRWMVVMGERRFRACKLNGDATAKCVVQNRMSNLDVLVEAIVENRQRVDVKPLEEAVAFQRALDAGMTVEALAHATGLQQAWRITERACLLNLRPEYQQLTRNGHLGGSQAYEMAQLKPVDQDRLFRAIKTGAVSTYTELRSMAAAIQAESGQGSLLGPDDVSPAERQLARSLEARIGKVAAMLRACTVENEVVAVRKVDPTRAGSLADLISAMQGDLARIGTALRAAGGCSDAEHQSVTDASVAGLIRQGSPQVKTSSWYVWRGAGRVGISVGTPRGMPAGYRLFRPLNPRREMLPLPPDEYEVLYGAILADLDPQATWDRLHELAGGAEPVLLCYERDPTHCHRRLVATWLEAELGHIVPEFDPQPVSAQPQLI